MIGCAGISFSRCFRAPSDRKTPDALKIPARRAEYSLTESASSPVQADQGMCSLTVIHLSRWRYALLAELVTTILGSAVFFIQID
jgi:hypothetical protein